MPADTPSKRRARRSLIPRAARLFLNAAGRGVGGHVPGGPDKAADQEPPQRRGRIRAGLRGLQRDGPPPAGGGRALPPGGGEPKGAHGRPLPRPAQPPDLDTGLCGGAARRRSQDARGAAQVPGRHQGQGRGARADGRDCSTGTIRSDLMSHTRPSIAADNVSYK